MECSQPGAIRDEELFAYLAGEKVRPVVAQHLATCQQCSSQLANYRRMELTLTSKLYRWDCPPSQVLGEYQLGLLSGPQVADVKAHLLMCTLCTAEVATLTQFLANDPMLVERAPVVQKRVSLRPSLNNHHPVQEAKRALDDLREQSLAGVRRIVATLLPAPPPLAFQRDVMQQAPAWPRRYSAEGVNISVQLEPEMGRKGALRLIGFVTREGSTLEALKDTPVTLASEAKTVYTQSIDELGNFVFSSIVPATYVLELHLAGGIVVIDDLAISAPD
jgi:hypothetical protein